MSEDEKEVMEDSLNVLRDFMAMMAMNAMLSSGQYTDIVDDQVAGFAYRMADAMLEVKLHTRHHVPTIVATLEADAAKEAR